MRPSTEQPSPRWQNSGNRGIRIGNASRLLGTAVILIAAASQCRADAVTLRSGAVVRGRVLDATAALGHRPSNKAEREQAARLVGVSTLSGGRLILDSGDVDTVTKRPFVIEEYEMRKR